MKIKSKFIYNFFLSDLRDYKKRIGQWCVIDMDKSKKGEIRCHYGKKLQDILKYRDKIKNPAFSQFTPVAPDISIPVTLHNEDTNSSITILSIPDSGADLSAFSYEVAEALGIDLKKCAKTKSYFGEELNKYIAYRKKLLMRIANDKYVFETHVDFIVAPNMPSLVGRLGFFQHYEIVFNPKFGIKYKFLG